MGNLGGGRILKEYRYSYLFPLGNLDRDHQIQQHHLLQEDMF